MIPRHLLLSVAVMLVVVIAMGVYMRHMRNEAWKLEAVGADAQPVTPPAAGPMEAVTLYVGSDATGQLRAQTAQIPLSGGRQQRAEELLRALLNIYRQPGAGHPLAAASDLRNIYLVDAGAAVIDINGAFADGHRSGIMVEQLTVDSLVETLAANVPSIRRVKILVDGKDRSTLAGHADLSDWFDVETVKQAMSGQ